MRIKLVLIACLLITGTAYAQYSKSTMDSQVTAQLPDNNTGQITPAVFRALLANILNSYQQYAGINTQAGTTYRVLQSDYGQIVNFNNGGTVNVALSPANVLTTFNFYASNISAGNVIITPTAGTLCGASTLTLTNSQSAWIISDGTNWQCQYGLPGGLLQPIGTTGHTIPLNDTGFFQSGIATFLTGSNLVGSNVLSDTNFAGKFSVAGNLITWPNSALTVARIDGAQTFVGDQLFTGGMLRLEQAVSTIASGACGATTNGVISPQNNGAFSNLSNNQSGLINIGAATTTTCTITFGQSPGPVNTPPSSCVLFPENASAANTSTTLARVSAISTANFVITGSALAGANYFYQCF